MNLLNNTLRNAFSTPMQMSSEIHAYGPVATAVVPSLPETSSGSALAEPLQVLRGKAESSFTDLAGQLSEVDVEIKRLMQEIDAVRTSEQNETSKAQDSQGQDQQVMANLQKAADSYHDMLDATSI